MKLEILVVLSVLSWGFSARAALPQKAEEFYQSDKLFYIYADIPWGAEGLRSGLSPDWREFTGTRLEIFLEDPHSQEPCPNPADLKHTRIYETDTFQIARKGNTSLWDPKPNIKIKLKKKQKLLGSIRRLNLNGMNRDVSQMREALAFEMFRFMDVPAPGHTYARFCIRNQDHQRHYIGLYSVIEHPDSGFIERAFPKRKKGNLFKANYESGADLVDEEGGATLRYRDDEVYHYADHRHHLYELSTNEDDPKKNTYEDFKRFVRAVNKRGSGGRHLSDEEYTQAVKDVFDIEGFLRWAAVNTLIGAWDNYMQTPGNYILYNGGHREKKFMEQPYFSWVPWDYDHSWGTTWGHRRVHEMPLDQWEKTFHREGKLPVITFALKSSEFRHYFKQQIERLLEKRFHPKWIRQRVKELSSHIAQSVYAEAFTPHGGPHTLRPFRNHTIWQFGWNNQYYWRSRDSQLPRNPDWGDLRSYGLVDFVKKRSRKAREELTTWQP